MVERHLRHRSLARLALEARALEAHGDAGVRLCERAPRDQLVLRGDAAARGFTGAVRRTLGADLPTEPNTAAGDGARTVLWLGPDEWLAVLPDGAAPAAVEALESALAGTHFAAVDVGHARAAIGIAGPGARRVLQKGTSIDLHPRAFGPGRCAQTTLARCNALIHQIGDEPAYDVWVARSFAEYAWRWLEDAAGEFGVAVESDLG